MKEQKEKVKYQEKEYEVKYLRERRYGERGELTVAYIELDNETHLVGVAERSPVDNYNEKQGKLIAFGRLQKKIKKRA